MSLKTGKLIIISAASGTGKTTLVRALCESDMSLAVSVSYTTRPKRDDEIEGIAYLFVDHAIFKQIAESDQFLECAEVFGHRYGTSKQWIDYQLNSGKDIILEIDWQGAMQIRQRVPDCHSIFILPPSFQALQTRLANRGQDGEQVIQQRMRAVANEISHYHEYDFLVINDEFTVALSELQIIINAVRKDQQIPQKDLSQFVTSLLAEAANFQ